MSACVDEESAHSVASFDTLPLEIITYIFNCLPYENISLLRGVSRNFDSVARSILNSSFFRLGEQLDKAMSSIKKMLPKRESQRRYHSLSRVNEVYSALETRYALLSMTFRKHIDEDSCCFIAGKVLDEGFAVLRVLDGCVKRREQPRETQELLRDIRDYSRSLETVLLQLHVFGRLFDHTSFDKEVIQNYSMAMEYFDEQIAPALRLRDPLSMLYRSRCRYSLGSLPNSSSSPLTDSLASTPSPSTSVGLISSPMGHCFGDLAKIDGWRKNLDEKIKRHERVIAEQDRVIREQSRAINSIIECMHRISSKISFNFMKELKAVEELSQPSSLSQGPSESPRSIRKRKASMGGATIAGKKGKSDN